MLQQTIALKALPVPGPEVKQSITDIKLIEMLTENTGRHMLDSGGAYGRNWERNQGEDFYSQPLSQYKFEFYPDGDWYVDFSINLFPYLRERLEYVPYLDNKFIEFCKEYDPEDKQSWADCLEAFQGVLQDKHNLEYKTSWNTYNDEYNFLSQVLQGYEFRDNHLDTYIALQIHGGCDVRGGYTRPVFFKLDAWTDFICDQADSYTISCNGETQKERAKNLPLKTMEDVNEIEYHIVDFRGGDWIDYEGGNIDINEFKITEGKDGEALCPHCKSRMEVYAYGE